jgi:hypothetical protein
MPPPLKARGSSDLVSSAKLLSPARSCRRNGKPHTAFNKVRDPFGTIGGVGCGAEIMGADGKPFSGYLLAAVKPTGRGSGPHDDKAELLVTPPSTQSSLTCTTS